MVYLEFYFLICENQQSSYCYEDRIDAANYGNPVNEILGNFLCCDVMLNIHQFRNLIHQFRNFRGNDITCLVMCFFVVMGLVKINAF